MESKGRMAKTGSESMINMIKMSGIHDIIDIL